MPINKGSVKCIIYLTPQEYPANSMLPLIIYLNMISDELSAHVNLVFFTSTTTSGKAILS